MRAERVAQAIARVIAEKAIAADSGLSRMDPLGRASARATMVGQMWPDLMDEALAACKAYPEPVSA